MKNKRHIGLDRYQIEFRNREEMVKWADKNGHKWVIQEIFIENGHCLEIKKLKVIQ